MSEKNLGLKNLPARRDAARRPDSPTKFHPSWLHGF
jgi:hypothetical protein